MVEIPKDKRYFRIGEASRIVGVEPYVLRYWETEFSQIRPKRASSRQRTYERKDLEIILEIKRLLYEERLTIEGARKKLQQSRVKYSCNTQMILNEIKVELENILRALSSPTLP